MRPEKKDNKQMSLFDNEKIKEMNIIQKVKEIEGKDVITLDDTVEFMVNCHHIPRFIGEYMQTKIRYDSLHKMLLRYDAGLIELEPEHNVEVLRDQEYYMQKYLDTLEMRAEIEKIVLPRI